MMASSSIHNLIGLVQMPIHLDSPHLPFPLPPSVLGSEGYGQRNFVDSVPTSIPVIESPWASNVPFPQGFVCSPLSPYFLTTLMWLTLLVRAMEWQKWTQRKVKAIWRKRRGRGGGSWKGRGGTGRTEGIRVEGRWWEKLLNIHLTLLIPHHFHLILVIFHIIFLNLHVISTRQV